MHERVAKMYWHVLGSNIQKVLDVGCGCGGFGKAIPRGSLAVGIDRDIRALQKASECEIVLQIDLEDQVLPFAEKSFDGVLARDILEHVAKPQEIVKEIYRVLRLGGIVIASVPMPKPKVVWSDYTHVRGFTKKAFKHLFEHNSFHVLWVYPIAGFSITNKLRIARLLPVIMKIPGFSIFAVSYLLKAVKIKNDRKAS